MISKTYSFNLVFTFDGRDDDLAEKLDNQYNTGAMRDKVAHALQDNIYSGGYIRAGTVVMHRAGFHKTRGWVVDHINSDPADNRISNLQIITVSENVKKARHSKWYRVTGKFKTDSNTIKLEYNIAVTFIVDDKNADFITQLDRKYADPKKPLVNTAKARVMGAIKTDGYGGIHTTVLGRAGIERPKGMNIDHINKDPGDNRLANLRVVTPTINNGGASDYEGVSWFKRTKKWKAQYGYKNGDGKTHKKHIGYFDIEEDAAIAYDDYIVAHNIDHRLNFPDRYPGYVGVSKVPQEYNIERAKKVFEYRHEFEYHPEFENTQTHFKI